MTPFFFGLPLIIATHDNGWRFDNLIVNRKNVCFFLKCLVLMSWLPVWKHSSFIWPSQMSQLKNVIRLDTFQLWICYSFLGKQFETILWWVSLKCVEENYFGCSCQHCFPTNTIQLYIFIIYLWIAAKKLFFSGPTTKMKRGGGGYFIIRPWTLLKDEECSETK